MKILLLSLVVIAQMTITSVYKNDAFTEALQNKNTVVAGLEYLHLYSDENYDEEKFTTIFRVNEGGNSERVVFWSDGIIRNFKIIRVDYVDAPEDFPFIDRNIIYQKDLLMPGEAIEYTTYLPCGIPYEKIEYTDGVGTVHRFLLAESGNDPR